MVKEIECIDGASAVASDGNVLYREVREQLRDGF